MPLKAPPENTKTFNSLSEEKNDSIRGRFCNYSCLSVYFYLRKRRRGKNDGNVLQMEKWLSPLVLAFAFSQPQKKESFYHILEEF